MLLLGACQPRQSQPPAEQPTVFSLEEVQRRSFRYFWELAYPGNMQIPDRAPSHQFSSIAATGFGLSAYLVGAERGYVSREAAAERVKKTLEVLWQLPQGPDTTGVSGYKGFFYHFLTTDHAHRYKKVELSTIDTALLMAGILSAQMYFDGRNETETAIRALADSLYRRVEWDWFLKENGLLSMGWHPERGFLQAQWDGYNEAMILLVLALGSPTHSIPEGSWEKWCKTYQWGTFYGQEHLNFSPLFGHQYSHIYIDFRGIQDAYMREKGIDYFENSRRATYSNRAYCMDNPRGFEGYGEQLWGLTACDGPGDSVLVQGKKLPARTYWARGASLLHINDDGTIAPTAVGGSVPFAPEICIPALRYMWETYYDQLINPYGFRDAFNLSVPAGEDGRRGWFDVDQLGIDQGPILLQIENHRSGLLWKLMKQNPYIIRGLKRAGFSGGWLEGL